MSAFSKMAEWTGLEPATPGVTGRYSNQLNYHSVFATFPHPNQISQKTLAQVVTGTGGDISSTFYNWLQII